MKVCMITPFRPEKDGVGDCSFSLIPKMKKYGVMDVEIISRRIKSKKKEKNIHRIIYKKNVTRSVAKQLFEEIKGLPKVVSDVMKSKKIIESSDSEIVHVQYEPSAFNLFYVPMLFRMIGSNRKKVITLHGRDYSLLKMFHRIFLYPMADMIIVHTDSHKKTLDRSNVKFIPMGINKIRNKYGWKFHNSALFFGFISPHKGVKFLIRAFVDVVKKIPNAKLLINAPINATHTAEVEYQKEIKDMIKKLGIAKNTKMVTKYTERKELPYIKSNIAVFPYTRTYSAGQSLALLDSIAAGKAVIVTRVPGVHERIKNGVNGFVVEPENPEAISRSILKLLGNREMLRKMCMNNVKMADNESWEEVVKRTVELYEEILRK